MQQSFLSSNSLMKKPLNEKNNKMNLILLSNKLADDALILSSIGLGVL